MTVGEDAEAGGEARAVGARGLVWGEFVHEDLDDSLVVIFLVSGLE